MAYSDIPRINTQPISSSLRFPVAQSPDLLTKDYFQSYVRKTIVNPAQFINLDNSGSIVGTIYLVGPQGQGKVIIPEELFVNKQYGGTPYATGTGDLALVIGSSGQGVTPVAQILTSAQIKDTKSRMVNIPLSVLALDTGSSSGFAGGDSSIFINLTTVTKYTAGNSNFIIGLRYRIESVDIT